MEAVTVPNPENLNGEVSYQRQINQVSDSKVSGPKTNFWRLTALVLLLYILIRGNLNLFTLKRQANVQPLTKSQTVDFNIATSQSEPKNLGPAPEKNTLYLGLYENNDVLFLSDAYSSNPVVGRLVPMKGAQDHNFDFARLQNPKKIFTFTKAVFYLDKFLMNNQKSTLFFSFEENKPVAEPYGDFKIYSVNLETLKNQELCSASFDEVYGSKGKAPCGIINQLFGDKILTFYSRSGCVECDLEPIKYTSLINIQTKIVKHLGSVGDLEVDLSKNQVSYKKLSPIKEPCEPSPGCEDSGQRTVYKSTGEVFIEALP